MRTNTKSESAPVFTHEGARALPNTPLMELRRTVLACLLWEDGFYEDGKSVADRIKSLVAKCQPHEVADLAREARDKQRLRHVPLLLARELARDSKRNPEGLVRTLLRDIVQRADELTEFLSLYWAEGKKPLAKQVKYGLANAFRKFDEYKLAKYDRDNAVKLRDVLFLVHGKPSPKQIAAGENARMVQPIEKPNYKRGATVRHGLFSRVVERQLAEPGTWENELSAGKDKKETFERLLREGKLGYMALLRNLRNMEQAKVDTDLVFGALHAGAANSKALPFRYVAAARAVPMWESQIDKAMQLAMGGLEKLPGKTAVLVDTSGSMASPLSSKSDLNRCDAAAALAVLVRGVAQEARVFKFDDQCKEVPARQGMALIDAIGRPSGGTYIQTAVDHVHRVWPQCERMIIITDEQSAEDVKPPFCKGYMINVATAKHGVGYGNWVRINGFSEAVVQYISELERMQ